MPPQWLDSDPTSRGPTSHVTSRAVACAIARAIDAAPEPLLSPPEAFNRPIGLAARVCGALRQGAAGGDKKQKNAAAMLDAVLPSRLHALPPASASCLASLHGVLMLGLMPPRSGGDGGQRLTRQQQGALEAHEAMMKAASALGHRILRISDCSAAQVVGGGVLVQWEALRERGAWGASPAGLHAYEKADRCA